MKLMIEFFSFLSKVDKFLNFNKCIIGTLALASDFCLIFFLLKFAINSNTDVYKVSTRDPCK